MQCDQIGRFIELLGKFLKPLATIVYRHLAIFSGHTGCMLKYTHQHESLEVHIKKGYCIFGVLQTAQALVF